MIRLVENKDWVIAIILGFVVLFIISTRLLHKNLSFWEYLNQDYYDNNNAMLSWLWVSFAHVVLLGALISQFIPIVPKSFISFFANFNFVPNKIGFFLIIVFLFQFCKSLLTYLFFTCTGNLKSWHHFYFVIHKFYMVFNIIFAILLLILYFVPLLEILNLKIFAIIFALIFTLKMFYLIMHQRFVLPGEWYYKFLYLCTLQIIPSIVLVKILYI